MAQLKSTNIFGTLKVHALTQSTSIDTGALTISGGVGIKKNLNVGGSATILGAVTGLTFNGLTISNSSSTLSLGGNLTTSSHNITLTTSGPTSITLPTSGILATTGNTETLTNKTISTGSTWKGNKITNTYLDKTTTTIGTTSIALGNSSTILTGLTSVTSTSFIGALTGNSSTATKLAATRNIALTGAVTGNVNFDGTGNVSIATTHTADPVITLTGDVSGTGTMTNLTDVSITTTVADDSHNHIIDNVDGLGTALGLKAPLASPTLTGTPVAPTATKGTKTTQIATTAFVSSAISDLVDSSPEALDTLNELAAALDNNPNFATTITAEIGKKANKVSSPTTGNFAGLSLAGDLTDSGYSSASFTAASHAGATGTAHGAATTLVNGFMSSADKSKLDGIETNANKYSLPTATDTTLGGVKIGSGVTIASGVISVSTAYAPSSHAGATGTAHGAATTLVNGFMSSADKTKLNGIETNANKYSLPAATASVLGGVKIGTGISNDSGLISVSTNYQSPLSNVVTGATQVILNGNTVRGLKQGTNVTITQAGDVITINSSYVNTTYTAGTGLGLTSNAFSVKYGTATGTSCQGDDTRLSNARTPLDHALVSASHTVSGLTAGHFLKATSATTYGFAAHGLTHADVGAAASSHDHDDKYYTESEMDTKLALNTPSGIIVMWSGLITAIPTGWFLCNGLNGTPDLRGRFIYGASVDADVKTTGGSADAIVVSHTHTGPAHTHTSAAHTHSTPNHTHTASSNSTGEHTHDIGYYAGLNSSLPPSIYISGKSSGIYSTTPAGAHSHTITVNSGGASTTGSTTPGDTGSSGTGNTGSTGSSGTNANLPPYMKLAYIMKG